MTARRLSCQDPQEPGEIDSFARWVDRVLSDERIIILMTAMVIVFGVRLLERRSSVPIRLRLCAAESAFMSFIMALSGVEAMECRTSSVGHALRHLL